MSTSSDPSSPIAHRAAELLTAARLFGGLGMCGVGIAMMVRAELGLGPWDVLHEGLAARTGMTIGVATIAVGAAIMALWIPLRERPGIGTLADVLVVGTTVDAALSVSASPTSMAARWVLVVVGPILFGVGAALYIGSGLGSGPRDGLMTGLARLGVPIAIARTSIELTVLLIGWILGGTIGFGTVYFAFIVGPVVHVVLPRVHGSRPAGPSPSPVDRRPTRGRGAGMIAEPP